MWKKIFAIFIISTCFFIKKVESQTLTYTFVDPCTNQISYFSVPATGTTITFLNQSAVFTSDDVANGNFGNWINTVYTNYRNLFPCPTTIQSNQTVLQTNQSIQNQITIQIIGNTVQSIVSNILGSLNQSMSMVDNNVSSDNSQSSGGDDAASKGKTESDKQKKMIIKLIIVILILSILTHLAELILKIIKQSVVITIIQQIPQLIIKILQIILTTIILMLAMITRLIRLVIKQIKLQIQIL